MLGPKEAIHPVLLSPDLPLGGQCFQKSAHRGFQEDAPGQGDHWILELRASVALTGDKSGPERGSDFLKVGEAGNPVSGSPIPCGGFFSLLHHGRCNPMQHASMKQQLCTWEEVTLGRICLTKGWYSSEGPVFLKSLREIPG